MKLQSVPLQKSHRKQDFSSGNPLLDGYLHQQASQDVKKRLAACFVWEGENQEVIGYYTLSQFSIPQDIIPTTYAKKSPPSYQSVHCTLLGRLAIDQSYQNQGKGQGLLVDALLRSSLVISEVSSVAVVADPIEEDVRRFYLKFGFLALSNGKVFVPMQTLGQLFKTFAS